mmetsp:Transcript_65398/g.185494  ORF Transcript_65398/g.185494 Transcript_65398/m.185494 type:complete len:268 (-) Transcript_65398:735-1538(-)
MQRSSANAALATSHSGCSAARIPHDPSSGRDPCNLEEEERAEGAARGLVDQGPGGARREGRRLRGDAEVENDFGGLARAHSAQAHVLKPQGVARNQDQCRGLGPGLRAVVGEHDLGLRGDAALRRRAGEQCTANPKGLAGADALERVLQLATAVAPRALVLACFDAEHELRGAHRERRAGGLRLLARLRLHGRLHGLRQLGLGRLGRGHRRLLGRCQRRWLLRQRHELILLRARGRERGGPGRSAAQSRIGVREQRLNRHLAQLLIH